MAIDHILGSDDAVETGASTVRSDDGDSSVIYVEGPMSVLEAISSPSSFVPSGMELVGSRIDPTDSGFGRMSVTCKDIGDATSAGSSPTHTTWRIDFLERQLPLQQHPSIPYEDRVEIYKWLATDTLKRFNPDNDAPQWVDENGTATALAQPYAIKFAKCYLRGIETFVSHVPVLQRIQTYKRLPGATMNKTSTTGGTANAITPWSTLDTFNTPDLKLSGYDNGGWFKSGDGYVQGQDQKWTRTDEWIWTPDYADNDIKWIYQRSQS